MRSSQISYLSGPLGVLEVIAGNTAPNISKLLKAFDRADGFSFDGGNICTNTPAFHIAGLYDHPLVTLHDVKDARILVLTITERNVIEGNFTADGAFEFLDDQNASHILRFFTVRVRPELKVVVSNGDNVIELCAL